MSKLTDYTKNWDEVCDKPNLKAYNEAHSKGATDTRNRWQRRGCKGSPYKSGGNSNAHRKHGLAMHIRIFKDEQLRQSKRNGTRVVEPVSDVRIVWNDGSPAFAM